MWPRRWRAPGTRCSRWTRWSAPPRPPPPGRTGPSSPRTPASTGPRSIWSPATWPSSPRRTWSCTSPAAPACAARGGRAGPAGGRPHTERDPLRPASPYAASKAEMEHLTAQAVQHGLSASVLRYFSVYGPRQRPDMAFHRFIEAGLAGRPLPELGDGSQSRAFTHVEDIVAATVAASGTELPPGPVLNIGHHERVPVREAIEVLAGLLGVRPRVRHHDTVPGDAARAWAATGAAARLLGRSARPGQGAGRAGQ